VNPIGAGIIEFGKGRRVTAGQSFGSLIHRRSGSVPAAKAETIPGILERIDPPGRRFYSKGIRADRNFSNERARAIKEVAWLRGRRRRSAIDGTESGLAVWRLTVKGTDVPEQSIIVDREFRPSGVRLRFRLPIEGKSFAPGCTATARLR
jgi:hypothetical protein